MILKLNKLYIFFYSGDYFDLYFGMDFLGGRVNFIGGSSNLVMVSGDFFVISFL